MNNEKIKKLKARVAADIASGCKAINMDLPVMTELIELAERATAAPANIDSPEFDKLLEKHAREFSAHSFWHVNDLIGANKSLYEHINAWGSEQYEAGRKEGREEAMAQADAIDVAKPMAEDLRARVERAEAALASRPAVDLSGLSKFNAVDFGPVPDGSYYLVSDVQALLSSDAQAPTGCSKDPACCPNNEGHGCDCSVPIDAKEAQKPDGFYNCTFTERAEVGVAVASAPTADEEAEAKKLTGDQTAQDGEIATTATTDGSRATNGALSWIERMPSADGLPQLPVGYGPFYGQIMYSAEQMRQARADALEDMRAKLDAALKNAQTGVGSHGANYDGNKLAATIRALIKKG